MSILEVENNVVDGQFSDAEEDLVKNFGILAPENFENESNDSEDEDSENENIKLDFMEWNERKNMTNQYLKFAGKISMGTNPQCGKEKQSLAKLAQDKIYLGQYTGFSFRKTDNYSDQNKDKSDKATLEKALNRGTMMVLYKMLNKIYTGIDGCVSTGKEANVYHATSVEGKSLAVKVFKTVSSEFKNRAKYMEGEYRFKFNTCTKNLTKLVPKWVEKEFRNLHRIYKAGIPSPEPICMNKNVLVMTFLGIDGRPAQKLKDYLMNAEEATQMYIDCVIMMRKMFQECKLVHADLSEFNMLVHQNKLFVIDVSQSLEMDNPSAMQFLHADITNVTSFFRKQQVNTMNHKQLKCFILTENSIEEKEYVNEKMLEATTRIYCEEDDNLKEESREDILLNPFALNLPKAQELAECYDESTSVSTENSEINEENGVDEKTAIYSRDKNESLEDKKARKKVIKELQREKRTHKIPKADKKRRVKLSKGKK